MTLVEKLAELETRSRALELDPEQRDAATNAVRHYVDRWIASLPEQPVFMHDEPSEVSEPFAVSDNGASIENALSVIAQHVDNRGQNTSSSRFFAYIPSGGLYTGALGDYLAAAVNRYVGVDYAGPGAARLEQSLIRWLAREVGYPDTAQGDLASGGSIATLSAIAAARQRMNIRAADVETSVVYLTRITHHCVTKALQIAGLSECPVRMIDLDAHYRMDADALNAAIDADRHNGLKPWLVVGSAGTTDLGSVDPLNELADIAEGQSLWFHIDAAYGGGFVLCEAGKARLAGIRRSDSVVINPHKGMYLPAGLGILLVRDGGALYEAFHARGSYMQDFDGDGVAHAHSACDFSPELTRPFRGLRLWLTLKTVGVGAFRAAAEEKLLLAEYFHERLSAIAGFETGPPPDLSIVAFRYRPRAGDADDFNRRLFQAIRDDGRIFLSTTTLNGHYMLRLAILGYHTHRTEVDIALDVLAEHAARLDAN